MCSKAYVEDIIQISTINKTRICCKPKMYSSLLQEIPLIVSDNSENHTKTTDDCQQIRSIKYMLVGVKAFCLLKVGVVYKF